MEGLTEGRKFVRYVDENGNISPAVIVKIWNRETGTVNLVVFVDDERAAVRKTSVMYRKLAPHEKASPSTWHFEDEGIAA